MASEPGRELASIDFESMLGGPLRAVVNAQAQAAMSSVNFIKSVGFKPGNVEDPTKAETGEPIYVAFKYPKELAPFQPARLRPARRPTRTSPTMNAGPRPPCFSPTATATGTTCSTCRCSRRVSSSTPTWGAARA